jgi:RNA polymerase sigma-70 factor (sigma-E family)
MDRGGPAERLDAVQAIAPVAAVDVKVEADLDLLYRRHAPAARRFAVMLTGDRTLSEDLVQEAFVRVAARLGGLREPAAFHAYLTRAVANLAKSHFRRQEVVRRHTRAVAAADLVEQPADVATSDALLVALRRLPVRQRAVLVLRYYDDLSQEEIAEVLGCPVGTVKSQLSRGLARLREDCRDV